MKKITVVIGVAALVSAGLFAQEFNPALPFDHVDSDSNVVGDIL